MDTIKSAVWRLSGIIILCAINIQECRGRTTVQCNRGNEIKADINCNPNNKDYFISVSRFYYGKTQSTVDGFCEDEVNHINQSDCVVEDEDTLLRLISCNTITNCNNKMIQPNAMVGCDRYSGDTYFYVEYECVKRADEYGQNIPWQDFGKTTTHNTNDIIYLITSSYPTFKHHDLTMCNIEMPGNTVSMFQFLMIKSIVNGNDTGCPYQFNVNDESTLLEFCFNEVDLGTTHVFPAADTGRIVQVVLQPNTELATAALMVRITVRHKNGGPPPYAMSIICDANHMQLPTPPSTVPRSSSTTPKTDSRVTTGSGEEGGNTTMETSTEGSNTGGSKPGPKEPDGKIGGIDMWSIIAGAAAGGLVLLVILIVIICMACKHHRRNNTPPKTLDVIDAWDGYGTAELPKQSKANVSAYDYTFPETKARPVKVDGGYTNNAMDDVYSEPVEAAGDPLYASPMDTNGKTRESNGYQHQINGPGKPINRQESLTELYSKPHKGVKNGTKGRKSMSPRGGTDRYRDEEGRVYDGRGVGQKPPVVDDTYTYSSEITPTIGGEIYQ